MNAQSRLLIPSCESRPREQIADWSVLRAGGELKSEPTTENRNRAHKAPVELGVGWIITPPQDGVKGL